MKFSINILDMINSCCGSLATGTVFEAYNLDRDEVHEILRREANRKSRKEEAWSDMPDYIRMTTAAVNG